MKRLCRRGITKFGLFAHSTTTFTAFVTSTLCAELGVTSYATNEGFWCTAALKNRTQGRQAGAYDTRTRFDSGPNKTLIEIIYSEELAWQIHEVLERS